MNRYWKVFFAVVLLLVLTAAVCGCKEAENTDTTALPAAVPANTETVPAAEETTLPRGEGVESIDDAPVLDPDDGQTVPEETTGPCNETVPGKTTHGENETKPAGETMPSHSTEPTENTDPAEETKPDGTTCCAYGAYMKMSAAEQQAYMNTFSSPLAFVDWCKRAEAEHKAHDDTIIVEGGDLDVGDYIE